MNKRSTSTNNPAAASKLDDTVSIVEARAHFGDLVSRTTLLNRRVFVTRHGKRIAALVSAEDAELLDAIEDRLDVEAVRRARRDIAAHGAVKLAKLVKELGL